MILSRDDHLSFSIYNRGFDQEEFFVQDLFTLNIWIKVLQQHIVDMRMNKFSLSLFLFRKLVFDLGAWERTHEHLPSIRRYSYQPLAPSSSSTNLTEKSTLRTKARSLDNLYQVGISAQPIITNRFPPSQNINYTINHHNSDEDNDNNNDDDDDDVDDDDDNESVLHTRL